MDYELLPCPCCGGKAHLLELEPQEWCAECTQCGLSTIVKVAAMREVRDQLAEMWNQRFLTFFPMESAPEDGTLVFMLDSKPDIEIFFAHHDGDKWISHPERYTIQRPIGWMRIPGVPVDQPAEAQKPNQKD